MSGKYIRFDTVDDTLVDVRSKKDGKLLGTITYEPRWKQWVLEGEVGVVWSWECLADVIAFLKATNAERRGG